MFSRGLLVGFMNPSKRIIWPAIFGVVFIFGYLWRLGSLLPGASADEMTSLQISSSANTIWQTPLNAPYYFLQYILLKVHLNHIIAGRLTSVIFIAVFTACLYYVAKTWFGRPSAVFSALLFMITPTVLIVGRIATPQVLLFSLIAIAAAFTWLLRTERRLSHAWLVTCVVVGLSIYIPGMVWILALGLILGYRRLAKVIAAMPKKVYFAGIFLTLLTLVPLVISMVGGNLNFRSLLWLPEQWPSVLSIAKFFGWSLLALFIKSPKHANYLLGRSPLVAIATAVLVVFGLYGLSSRLNRSVTMLAVLMVPVFVLSAINQDITPLYFTLPILIALAAIGIRFLYLEWRSIFPLNPLPRALALILIVAILISTAAYGFRYALVAWPNNPDVRSAYMLK